MKRCIFVGPALYGVQFDTALSGLVFFEPARLGSVFQAAEAGYQAIGIVDGYFGTVAPVWHKEILYAMSQGVQVFGAASIGALRAAELSKYGMKGVGAAYRLFSSGALTDDDEVCLIHASKEQQYRPLSVPMVNFRFTMRRLTRKGLLTKAEERRLVEDLKRLHFSERTADQLTESAVRLFGKRRGEELNIVARREYIDIKRLDCTRLIKTLLAWVHEEQNERQIDWSFPKTQHWKAQFGLLLQDLPQLTYY